MSETQSERCVADAAILHDLDQTRLLPPLLESRVSLTTIPNVLIELRQEFCGEVREHCRKGQMSIEVATAGDMNNLLNEVGPANRMSVTDGLLCRLAKRMNASLLSGCDYLSGDAERRGIRARSIIWVLDRLVKTGLIRPAIAAKKLAELQNSNPWMNPTICRQYIARWQAMMTQSGILTGLVNT